MIVAAGATGRPVVSSAYPEWIAQYMLEQNNGYYPLPVSMSNMLAYLFPATAQAYWDEVLEHAFAANQQRLGSAKLGLPTALVAPIMFVLDLLCSAGLLLFALANAKVIAALAAVAVVARARRVAKQGVNTRARADRPAKRRQGGRVVSRALVAPTCGVGTLECLVCSKEKYHHHNKNHDTSKLYGVSAIPIHGVLVR